MNILGIIPARGGSKGIPGKNIKPLAGKPLIYYTIDASKQSKLTRVIVSTDDDNIGKIAMARGVDVPFKRPQILANDTAKSIDVAIHALFEVEKADQVVFDAVMLLQPTAPFRNSEDIDRAIEILKQTPDADSVISVVDVEAHHPARMKYLENGQLLDPPFCETYENQNRQELTSMYIRNGAIYLTKRDTLLSGSYKGKKCMALVMPAIRSCNIDSHLDFEYSEWIHKTYLS